MNVSDWTEAERGAGISGYSKESGTGNTGWVAKRPTGKKTPPNRKEKGT